MPFAAGNNANPSGRPRGARDHRLRERDARTAEICARLGLTEGGGKLDAHGLLVAVYAEPGLPIELRVDAAKAALRVEKPALAAATVSGDINHTVSIADQLARALRRVTIDVLPVISGQNADTMLLENG